MRTWRSALVLIALVFSACSEAPKLGEVPACGSSCLVSFARTGGFASGFDTLVVNTDGSVTRFTQRTVTHGTAPPDAMSQLRMLLASDDFRKLEASYSGGSVRDGVAYTIQTSAGKRIVASGGYPEVLKQVISACEAVLFSRP
jgi:hypothetical protein